MTRNNARIVAEYLREAGWGEGAIAATTAQAGAHADLPRPDRGNAQSARSRLTDVIKVDQLQLLATLKQKLAATEGRIAVKLARILLVGVIVICGGLIFGGGIGLLRRELSPPMHSTWLGAP
jgi:hypothetical protein